MSQDTHRIRWKVIHGVNEGTDARERDFNSLTRALRFIRDESAAADNPNGQGYARLVSDELCVASFAGTEGGVEIGEDAISLVGAAWGSLDDD